VVVVVQTVVKIHVVVLVHQLIHQLIHQARLFQIQILFVLLEKVAPFLKMEILLNYGSMPKQGPVQNNTTLDPVQSTGQKILDVTILPGSMENLPLTHRDKLRFPKLPST
jgi:hypothetical protein